MCKNSLPLTLPKPIITCMCHWAPGPVPTSRVFRATPCFFDSREDNSVTPETIHSYTSRCPIGSPSLSPPRSCSLSQPSFTLPHSPFTFLSLAGAVLYFPSFEMSLWSDGLRALCYSVQAGVPWPRLSSPTALLPPPWSPRSPFVVWFLF